MRLTELVDDFLGDEEDLAAPDEIKSIQEYSEESEKDFSLDFVGVGFSRCGTTFVSDLLAQHPEICFPEEKELHFFGNFYRYREGTEGISENFDCEESQLVGEFTPRYSIQDRALERIKKSFEDVKIIVCLRDPVDRAFSQYKWFRYNKGKEYQEFEDALEGFLSKDYLDKSRYSERVSKIFEIFGRDSVHLIFFEDIVESPGEVASDLYRFLEIDKEFEPKDERANQNSSNVATERNAFYVKFMRYENLARRLALKLGINRILRPVANPLLERTKQVLDSRKETEGDIELDVETRSRVFEKYFRKDVENLEDLLGEEFPHWKYEWWVIGIKPNFLIPGASRSGTTSLYNYLRNHPEIFMPENKEIRYFDRDNRYPNHEWYLNHFRWAEDEKIAGESSPPYFYDNLILDSSGGYQGPTEGSVVERILDFNSEMKILISLRNPVDRAYSQYWKNRNTRGKDDSKSFRRVVEEEIQGVRSIEETGACRIYKNRYSQLLEPWLDNFPEDQVKVIIFDEWIQDPESVLEEISEFLGVDPSYDFSGVVNEKKNSSSIYRSKLLKYAYRKNPVLKYLYRNHVLDTKLENLVKKITHQSGYPDMSDETREFVYSQLEDDIRKTEEILGRDLDVWKP